MSEVPRTHRRRAPQTNSQGTRANRRRIPVQENTSNTDAVLQKKLAKLAELHNGIEILKERMTLAKRDLMSYLNQNPELKHPKYSVGERYIRYVDKKTTDGMSQRLILVGLSDYFQNYGAQDAALEASKALTTILSHRKSRIVPTIDITKDRLATSMTTEVDDDEEDEA